MKTILLSLIGTVHGVGYRKFVKDLAEKHHITGYALNLPDGSLIIALQGKEEEIQAVLPAMKKGPQHAHVEKIVESTKDLPKHYQEFIIAGPGYLHSGPESL